MAEAAGRTRTDILVDLLDVAAKDDATDPLVLMCQTLVRNVPAFKFVTFVHVGEDVWHIPCAQPGFQVRLAPPDVELTFVRFLEGELAEDEIAFLGEEHLLPFIPEDSRTLWTCHSCAAFSVRGEGSDRAILIAFLEGDCPFGAHLRADVRRMAAGLVSVYGFLCVNRRLRKACVAAQASARRQSQTLESVRGVLRNAFAELGERLRKACVAAQASARRQSQTLESVRGVLRNAFAELGERVRTDGRATVTWTALRALVAQGAPELVAFANDPEIRNLCREAALNDSGLSNWVHAGLDDARVKVLVGVRGANKTGALLAVRDWLRARGVEEARLVSLDFEDVRFRHFATADDVLCHLEDLPPCAAPRFLFLDEVCRIGHAAELLRRLSRMSGWNVWVASSTSCVLGEGASACPSDRFSVLRVWPNPGGVRSRQVLSRIWSMIFMRDIAYGVIHPDVRALEALTEYFSDHLGEVKTLREIASELVVYGRRISANSIRAYRKELESVYLLEVSEVYDTFERGVVKSAGARMFCADLELRAWRYGPAPEYEASRVALNTLYLRLRRTYDKVYTPRDKNADFLTLEPDGTPRLWSVAFGSAQEQAFFHPFGQSREGGGGILGRRRKRK